MISWDMPSPKKKVFKTGDNVLAKWGGSNKFYEGKIVSKKGNNYEVKYDDGSTANLSGDDIKARPSTPGRRRSTSKGRSTSRGSRSSSRSRSASPSRRKKEVKTPKTPPKPKPSPSRKKPTPATKTKKTPEKDLSPRVTRSRLQTTSEKKSVEVLKKDSKLFLAEADLDDIPKRIDKTRKLEFGGPFGALFITLLFLAIIILLLFSCTKTQCSVKVLPTFPKTWTFYLDKQSFLIFSGWMVWLAILQLIPIGRTVPGFRLNPSKPSQCYGYRMNGFLSLVLSLGAIPVMDYYKLPVSVVYVKYQQLMIAGMILSIVASILIYIKARRAPNLLLNPAGNSGNVMYDFLLGHELNPRIGDIFDLKTYFFRVFFIGWAMVNGCLAAKVYKEGGFSNIPFFLTVGFQLIYVAELVWNEETLLSTFAYMYEGVGFHTATFTAMYPFVQALPSYFTAANKGTMPTWLQFAIAVFFFIGFFILVRSKILKHNFRRNPYSPGMSNLDSIPTGKRKRLLVAGWWGFVRHPNYLGDLIMNIAICLPVGFSYFLPYGPALLTVLSLTMRIQQVETKCKAKYGSAWENYKSEVRHKMIPFIY